MKKNNYKQRSLVSLVISITVFITLIVSAAYAIVGASIIYDEANITANLGTRPIFVSDVSKQMNLNIEYVPLESDNSYVLATDNSTVNISLSTSYSSAVSCSYDIVWKWDETDDTSNRYTRTTGETKEYTILGSSTSGTSFSEKQVNNYSTSNLKTVLYTGTIEAAGNNAITYDTWTLNAKFYKTKTVQSTHRGASYSGKILIENVLCEKS